MLQLQKILAVVIFSITTQGFSEEVYHPATGDKDLDFSLQQINKIIKNKKSRFIKITSGEFQVQQEKIAEILDQRGQGVIG